MHKGSHIDARKLVICRIHMLSRSVDVSQAPSSSKSQGQVNEEGSGSMRWLHTLQGRDVLVAHIAREGGPNL